MKNKLFKLFDEYNHIPIEDDEIKATEEFTINEAKKLINQMSKDEIKLCDDNGNTLLTAAIDCGISLEIVNLLLLKLNKETISAKNKWGETALSLILDQNVNDEQSLSIIKEIIKITQESGVNFVNHQSYTPLMWLLKNTINNNDFIKEVISFTDSKIVNFIANCKDTILSIALEKANFDVIKALIPKLNKQVCELNLDKVKNTKFPEKEEILRDMIINISEGNKGMLLDENGTLIFNYGSADESTVEVPSMGDTTL